MSGSRDHYFPQAVTESKSLRDKDSRASKGAYREGESSRAIISMRNPREDNLYAGA